MQRLLIAILLIQFLAGCNSMRQPDLVRLYDISDKTQQQNPVILIHGAFGSKLAIKNSAKEVWPGGLFDILFEDYADLKLPIDGQTLEPASSNLTVLGITDKIAGRDFYGRIIKTLEQAGRYKVGELGKPAKLSERRYYVFNYDWRMDNVQTSSKLDQFIDQIRNDFNEPNLKVDIVAHSMGGMVSRYYLRYGTNDVLNNNDFPTNSEGLNKIDKVILVGTPNLGSVTALQHIISGFKIGFDSIPSEVLATFPSSYQLLPHSIRNWLITREGKSLQRDIFDIEFWQKMQWSIFDPNVKKRIVNSHTIQKNGEDYYNLLTQYFHKHLERARRFTWSLTVPNPDIKDKLVVFGSACELTPARLLIEEVNGESITRLWPSEIDKPIKQIDYTKLMLEPGDGSVTKSSLLARNALDPSIPRHKYSYFPLDFSMMYCAKHDQLTGDLTFQDNLLHILLSIDHRR